MAGPRRLRRFVLVLCAVAGCTALFTKLLSIQGYSSENLKTQLSDLKEYGPHLSDIKAELGDLRIPGRPKKPWHENEKIESPLERVDNHPIALLMQDADQAFRQYEEKRSRSFRETVSTYRKKYGRHPPPGFKQWYKFARKRNVHNIDDFDQIMDDLRPFWGVQPRIIRNLAANMWRDREKGISSIHIRNHRVAGQTNAGWRVNALVSLVKRFVKYLPDMDICMNSLDQPRVVVPWDDMQVLLASEAETRRTPPETSYEFSEGLSELANVSTLQVAPPLGSSSSNSSSSAAASSDGGVLEDAEWYPWHGKQYMDVVRTACPPGSPAWKQENGGGGSGTSKVEAENMYKSSFGGLITNFNLSTDLCTVGPELADKHGLLYSSSTLFPTRRLVPIFGECKVSVNSDILFPANMYWLNDKRYLYDGKHDKAWEDKADMMIWRGVTSGGTQVADNWQRMHRQRLVMAVNSTQLAAGAQSASAAKILVEQPERRGEYENFRNFQPAEFAREHTDVGFTEAWGCVPDCSFYSDVWTLKPELSLADQFKSKFVVDVDGHSFSGRWRAFLESRSLGIKATIFREWHDSRLFAWRHFVPMDNRYDDIYALLTYFMGTGTPPSQREEHEATSGSAHLANSNIYSPRHDTEGKRLAEQGREWAKKVLRRDDIEIYIFRLLLEYGRIIDDNRDRIGYSGDGSELDKYDGVSQPSEVLNGVAY